MRTLLALVSSYLFMGAFAVASVIAITLASGTGGSGDWPDTRWFASVFGANFVQAILGGALCGWIAGRRRAVTVLAGIVLVSGSVSSVLVLGSLAAEGVSWPPWMIWGEPWVDSLGVLLGGRLVRERAAPPAPPTDTGTRPVDAPPGSPAPP